MRINAASFQITSLHSALCLRSQARGRRRLASSPGGCIEAIVWEARPRGQTVMRGNDVAVDGCFRGHDRMS